MKKAVEEFTVEANPESADEDFLRACASGGVSRISLGAQTFHDPSRRAVHRLGDSALVEERLALAARYFPGAFSVDLITGLPFQDTGRRGFPCPAEMKPTRCGLPAETRWKKPASPSTRFPASPCRAKPAPTTYGTGAWKTGSARAPPRQGRSSMTRRALVSDILIRRRSLTEARRARRTRRK